MVILPMGDEDPPRQRDRVGDATHCDIRHEQIVNTKIHWPT
jgi:hypothetical protein